MELREYWEIARKRGWIIVLVAVVAAVAALGLSLLMSETYKASIQLSANPARADWGLNQATQDLLRNYVLNIKSHRMTQEAINRAQLDMSTYDFLANLDVSADSSNLSITIQAESHDPNPLPRCADDHETADDPGYEIDDCGSTSHHGSLIANLAPRVNLASPLPEPVSTPTPWQCPRPRQAGSVDGRARPRSRFARHRAEPAPKRGGCFCR